MEFTEDPVVDLEPFPEIEPLDLENDFSFAEFVQCEPDGTSHGLDPVPSEVSAHEDSPAFETDDIVEHAAPLSSDSVIPGPEWNLMIAGAFGQYRQQSDKLKHFLGRLEFWEESSRVLSSLNFLALLVSLRAFQQ